MDTVFPQGATEHDLLAIYRPRPGLPFVPVALADGRKRLLWTTFTPQQIDIDVQHPQGRAYLRRHPADASPTTASAWCGWTPWATPSRRRATAAS